MDWNSELKKPSPFPLEREGGRGGRDGGREREGGETKGMKNEEGRRRGGGRVHVITGTAQSYPELLTCG